MVEVQTEGLDDVIAGLVAMARGYRKVVMLNLKNLGEMVRYLCRIELADVRYTGRLESSFVVEANDAAMSVSIYPTAKHRMFVRTGTRPHWAPIGPLKMWARAKLGDERAAYPVQRSIASYGTSMYQQRKRGTKANPWPQRVLARGDFQTAVRATAARIGAQLIEVQAG